MNWWEDEGFSARTYGRPSNLDEWSVSFKMTWNFLDESIFRGTIALSFFKLQNCRFKVIVEYDANFILFLFFLFALGWRLL